MKKIYVIVSSLLLLSMDVQAIEQVITRAVRPDEFSYVQSAQLISCGHCKDLLTIAQLVLNVNNGLLDCCADLTAQIQHLESAIDEDITHIVDVLDAVSNVDLFISSFETLFSLVESLDQSLLASLITTIQGLDSSFDQVSSLLDYDIGIDQTTLSKIVKIDTQLDVITSFAEQLLAEDCASTSEVIASELDSLASSADLILLATEQILDLEETIASTIDKIDTQLDTVQSLLEVAVQECASRTDAVIDDLLLLQEQEASCCFQLSSDIDALRTDIDSRLDLIQETADGLSNIETIVSQLSLLVSVIDDLHETLLISLLDTTVSEFDLVSSQLDRLFACGSTPISSPTTITAPGNYCLDQDITGNIIIAVSDVKLDLNRHLVSGSIAINAGLSNIKVSNGVIDAGASNGFVIANGCDTISLMDLHIISGLNGVVATGSPIISNITNILIDHVIAENCSNNGYLLQECYGNITGCAAFSNGSSGFQIQNSTNLYVIMEDNEAVGNVAEGFLLSNPTSIVTASYYNVNNCSAYANGSHGFSLGSDIGGVNIYVANCIAANNGTVSASDGFFVNNAVIMGSVTGVITNCTAMQNTRAGFNTDQYTYVPSCSDPFLCFRLRYTGNYAVDNKLVISGKVTNYAVALTTASATNTFPYQWISWNNANAGSWINTDGNN